MELLREISENLHRGEDENVAELTKKAIEENIPPLKILDDGLIAGMNIVGKEFCIFLLHQSPRYSIQSRFYYQYQYSSF